MAYAPEILSALAEQQRTFAWETKQFPKYERSRSWYFWMTIVATFLVAYAIWSGNFLFAFLILLIGIILILAGNEDPNTILVQIGENGIVWDGKLYLFQELGDFAIVYQPPQTKVLYIDTKTMLTPRLRIPLEEESPVEIRTFLKTYLQEDLDLQNEYLSDILARILKI
ncbi:hypothetical protein KBA73_01800 [Patescibacteria group bacterium]|nr:hypothetical protein [Patescibacteria group bacterium]